MSEFGTFLENQRDIQNLSAKEMAARLGMAQSALSHLTTDARRGVRPASLAKIVSGVSDDPDVQAQALAACFRDQCTARYKGWVQVHPPAPGDRVAEEPEVYCDEITKHAQILRELKLPHSVVRAFTEIARGIPGRQKFRVVIEDLGKFSREELIERPDDEA